MLAILVPRSLGERMNLLLKCCLSVVVISCSARTAACQAVSPVVESTDSQPETPQPVVADGLELEHQRVVFDELLLSESTSEPGESPAVVVSSVEICDQCSEDCDGACDDGSEDEPIVSFGDWVGYNPAQSNTTWLVSGDFGMFSMESFPTLKFGKDSSLLFGTGFHFLDGPAGAGINAPDMPPRLFDLQAAYHVRKRLSDSKLLDVKLGVGVFTDFERSARKGVRFPGHLVGYNELTPNLVSVMGIEVLDRDDISVLPVGGLVWKPYQDLIFECVFPRPRISMRVDDDSALYFGGELGGGTWAIQRDNLQNDNVTYRDLRVAWGIQEFDKGSDTSFEIGWAVDRSLEYRSGLGNTDFDGAFLLRWHKHY